MLTGRRVLHDAGICFVIFAGITVTRWMLDGLSWTSVVVSAIGAFIGWVLILLARAVMDRLRSHSCKWDNAGQPPGIMRDSHLFPIGIDNAGQPPISGG